MRRVYRHGSVEPSDDVVLLDDGLPGVFEEEEFELYTSAEAEGDAQAESDMPSDSDESADDTGSENAEDTLAAPRAKRYSGKAGQDIASAERLRDQIIQNATAEAAKIVEKAHNEALEVYRAAMEKAMAQIEKDRDEAIKIGRTSAFEEHSAEITACINSIVSAICRLEAHQAKLITGFEDDIKWLALEIAQKILKQKIDSDPACLAPMIEAAVKNCKNAPWITLEISDSVPKLLSQLQDIIANDSIGEKVTIKTAKAPVDTCVIETPDKFFDASVSQQIENLKGYFLSENEG